jgi:hypothetical protein
LNSNKEMSIFTCRYPIICQNFFIVAGNGDGLFWLLCRYLAHDLARGPGFRDISGVETAARAGRQNPSVLRGNNYGDSLPDYGAGGPGG